MNKRKIDRIIYILIVLLVLCLIAISGGLSYYKGVAVGTERAIDRIKGITFPVEIEVNIQEELEEY